MVFACMPFLVCGVVVVDNILFEVSYTVRILNIIDVWSMHILVYIWFMSLSYIFLPQHSNKWMLIYPGRRNRCRFILAEDFCPFVVRSLMRHAKICRQERFEGKCWIAESSLIWICTCFKVLALTCSNCLQERFQGEFGIAENSLIWICTRAILCLWSQFQWLWFIYIRKILTIMIVATFYFQLPSH